MRTARAPSPAPLRRPAEVRPPGLHVVRAPEPARRARRARARGLTVLAAFLAVVTLFGVVAFHVLLTQGQLQLQHLQDRDAAALARNQELRLQVAELESPARIVAAAQQLGMVPPATVTYLSPSSNH